MAEHPIYINPLITGGAGVGGAAAPPARPQETPVDHGTLRNIGVRSHAEIDELLAAAAKHATDATIHFTRESLTHAGLQDVGGTKSHAEIDELLAAAASHASDAAVHFPAAGITLSAAPGGESLVAMDTGPNLSVKSIAAGPGIKLSSTAASLTISAEAPARAPLRTVTESVTLTPTDVCGVVVIAPSADTVVTLPALADYPADCSQTAVFVRSMAAGARFSVALVAPDPGWEGRGVRALSLNESNTSYTVHASRAIYVHSSPMKISAASRLTAAVPMTDDYKTPKPIPFGAANTAFAEFFEFNPARTALTVRVAGTYQISCQCSVDSTGSNAARSYQVCMALEVAPPGAAPAIVPGTQTILGNYQEEDSAMSFFHPAIFLAAGSAVSLTVCQNGALTGGLRSAALIIKGEF